MTTSATSLVCCANAVLTAVARIPQAPDMSNARLMFTVTPWAGGMRARIHKFCFATRHGALARAATNPECCRERNSFSKLLRCNSCNSFNKRRAMRREQRQRHVLLYVAHGNQMRCRFNRDSVSYTLHVQPPRHHSIACFFRATFLAQKDLCRPASEFPLRRQSTLHMRCALRNSAKTSAVYFAKCFT